MIKIIKGEKECKEKSVNFVKNISTGTAIASGVQVVNRS